MTGIVWFRRDLRLRDHPALRAALDRHDRVVPVFCFDDRLLHGRHASGSRTQFLLECLAELDDDLRGIGSGLVVRRGRPEHELPVLAREAGDRAPLHGRRQPVRAAARRSHAPGAGGARRRDGRAPGALRGGRRRRCSHAAGQAVHGLLPVSSQLAGPRAPRCPDGAQPDAATAVPAREGPPPLARGARAQAGGGESTERRRGGGARSARPLPRRPGCATTRTTTMLLAAT